MTTLKKYTLTGQDLGGVAVPEIFSEVETNNQMVKDYIIALRANARQWSANTKGRSEVAHSTQKPHKQKGLGRSRQGSLAAPQYKGGGRVFGPKPKFDQHVKINRKEKRLAMCQILSEKVAAGRLHVVDSFALEQPKTKAVSGFMKKVGLAGKRVLFLMEAAFEQFECEGEICCLQIESTGHKAFAKSVSNIPRTAFSLVTNTNGYDLICAHDVVITEKALNDLVQNLSL